MILPKRNDIQNTDEEHPISGAEVMIKTAIMAVDNFVREHKHSQNREGIEFQYKMIFVHSAYSLQAHINGVFDSCNRYISDPSCTLNSLFENSYISLSTYQERVSNAISYAANCKHTDIMKISADAPTINTQAYEMEISLKTFPQQLKRNGLDKVVALHDNFKELYDGSSLSDVLQLLLSPIECMVEMIRESINIVKDIRENKKKEEAYKNLVNAYQRYQKSEYMRETKAIMDSYTSMELNELEDEKAKIVKRYNENFVCANSISSEGEFTEDGALLIYKNENTTEPVLNEGFHLLLCRKKLTHLINTKIAVLINSNPEDVLLFLPKEERTVETLDYFVKNTKDLLYYKCSGNVTVQQATAFLLWVYFDKLQLEKVPDFGHGTGTAYFDFLKKLGIADWKNSNHIKGELNKISGKTLEEIKNDQPTIWEVSNNFFWSK